MTHRTLLVVAGLLISPVSLAQTADTGTLDTAAPMDSGAEEEPLGAPDPEDGTTESNAGANSGGGWVSASEQAGEEGGMGCSAINEAALSSWWFAALVTWGGRRRRRTR